MFSFTLFTANANIFGGTITSRLNNSQGNSNLLVAGGTIALVSLGGGGRTTITGGIFTDKVDLGGLAELSISGGEFAGDLQVHDSLTNVSGGTFTGLIRASGNALLDISGGLPLGGLLALDDSVVQIFGSGFNFPLGDIVATSGTLTGTLADGTPINVNFGRASTATITLPEPSALTALGSGIAMLALLYRRRQRSVKW